MKKEQNERHIERLREGEKILCSNCKKDYYVTSAKDIKISHSFICDNCGDVVRETPIINIE